MITQFAQCGGELAELDDDAVVRSIGMGNTEKLSSLHGLRQSTGIPEGEDATDSIMGNSIKSTKKVIDILGSLNIIFNYNITHTFNTFYVFPAFLQKKSKKEVKKEATKNKLIKNSSIDDGFHDDNSTAKTASPIQIGDEKNCCNKNDDDIEEEEEGGDAAINAANKIKAQQIPEDYIDTDETSSDDDSDEDTDEDDVV